MVPRQTEAALDELYETDETAWLEESARLLDERRFDELDLTYLAEYLRDMARRDKREVLSRLTFLLAHLLKWDRQPDRRTASWRVTIDNQRDELNDLLESGTLRRHAEEILPRAYERARRQAVADTGLSDADFPPESPVSIDQLLGEV
jgi:uncharacterized protein DUF29